MLELRRWRRQRGWGMGAVCFPPRPTRSLVNSVGSGTEPRPQKHFGEFFLVKTSDSSGFHHFCVGKKCWNCSLGKIVPGQNDTFAPVVPHVPGHFSRCPCGVGTYGSSSVWNMEHHMGSSTFAEQALCSIFVSQQHYSCYMNCTLSLFLAGTAFIILLGNRKHIITIQQDIGYVQNQTSDWSISRQIC